MGKLSSREKKAKDLIIEECKRHYNNHECMTKCRCRIDGKCKGTTKDNKWNEKLIELLEK